MKANEATGGGGGDSKFTQQELPACKPILTPGWVVATFIIIGCVFIPISLVSLFASERRVRGFKPINFMLWICDTMRSNIG
ncbi:ALA-interacting subunit 5-like [Tripterygium wilfordii]|uniref:ALA-interacting subunit 5-like n=1 Tax=Tripterygium wilfordii TaxID=458696 RepID=A0A7J7DNQ4_TRIWF|nr:ALA-interacting subunit 5-like [Tripterygium wilfordii]